MNAQIKQQWINALLSGNYKQGTQQLRLVGRNDEYRYCCLGVLCDISGLKKWNDCHYGSVLSDDRNLFSLTTDIMSWADINDDEYEDGGNVVLPIYDREFKVISLTILNDRGFTFSQIADVIRHFL